VFPITSRFTSTLILQQSEFAVPNLLSTVAIYTSLMLLVLLVLLSSMQVAVTPMLTRFLGSLMYKLVTTYVCCDGRIQAMYLFTSVS
jgi:hypothetical protein